MKNLYHPGQKQIGGLRLKTWASIVILVLIASFPATIGYNQQQLLSHYKHLAFPQAFAKTWALPQLAPVNQQEKVKYVFHKIWGKDAQIGIRIARCESGFNESALHSNTDGSFDAGIMQINSIHKMPDMLNGTANITYAYLLYQNQGTTPWTASQGCWQ